MKIIYQIGRVEKNILEKKNFKIENKVYPAYLSGISLKNYFEEKENKKDVKLVLVYPISMALNRTILSVESSNENLNNFIFKIREILEQEVKFKEFLSNPKELFKIHPYNIEFANDFFVIHSTGFYEGKQFSCKFDFIVLEVFCEMLKRYFDWLKNSNNDTCELYIDISTGQNIYVASMLEAVKDLIVFHKLQNWIKDKNLIVRISYSDPVIGTESKEFQVYLNYELDIKAFVSSPLKLEEFDNYFLVNRILKNLNDLSEIDTKSLKHTLQDVFKNFLILFSSFKNTLPLMLFCYKFDTVVDIDNFLLKFLDICFKIINKDWQNGVYIIKEDFKKVFFSFAFYRGLLKILEKENISYQPDGVVLSKLEEVKNVFERYFNLNVTLLGNELRSFKEGYEVNNVALIDVLKEDSWLPLKNFVRGETKSFDPRNFFAHAGFERNVTVVKKENNELKLKYVDDFKNISNDFRCIIKNI